MIKPTGGKVLFKGKDITNFSVRKRRLTGMSHIPEDRLKMGLAAKCSIRDNMILNRYFQKPYSRHGVMNNKLLSEFSDKLCKDFEVLTPGSEYAVSTLSGGNMQKVVIGREMETNPNLLHSSTNPHGESI